VHSVRQRRQASAEAAVAEEPCGVVVLVEQHLLRVGEVELLLHPLHLVQERVVLVDQRRVLRGRVRARGRGGCRRQRERVAGVEEERRREAGVVGVGERVEVLRAQHGDLAFDVRRVEREAGALPALQARVPVVFYLVVRPPRQLKKKKGWQGFLFLTRGDQSNAQKRKEKKITVTTHLRRDARPLVADEAVEAEDVALLLGGERALAEVRAEVVGPPEPAALAAALQPRSPAHGVPVALAVPPHVVDEHLVLALRPRPLLQPAAVATAFPPTASPRHRPFRQPLPLPSWFDLARASLLPSQPQEQGRESEKKASYQLFRALRPGIGPQEPLQILLLLPRLLLFPPWGGTQQSSSSGHMQPPRIASWNGGVVACYDDGLLPLAQRRKTKGRGGGQEAVVMAAGQGRPPGVGVMRWVVHLPDRLRKTLRRAQTVSMAFKCGKSFSPAFF
jgi:hypothetical protein